MPVESYGRVTSLSEQQQAPSNNTIRRRRRQTTTSTYDNNNNNNNNTNASNIHYNDNQQYQKEKKYDNSYTTTTSNRTKTKTKTHNDNMNNTMTSFFPPILLLLIVPLLPIFFNASSSINPLRYTIIGSLLVYAFDFIGPSATTETTIVWIIWATFFVVSFSFIYGQEQDFSNLWMIRLIRMGTPILHFICCASYMALQVFMSSSSNSQINNIQEDDNFTFPKILEDMIFTFTPVSFASILTYYYCTSSTSLVNTTTRTAHLTFPLLYSISMYYLLKSSPSQKQQQKYATIHFMVLLIFPILIYTTSQVIMASSLSESTPVIVEDLILAITLPLMIFQSLTRKFSVDDEPMETQSDITSSFAHKFIQGLKNMLSTNIHNNNNNNNNNDLSATIRNRIILLFITCYVASKRYIVPTICVNISNQIYHGGYHDATANGRINITISSLFMTTSILLFMLSHHISRFNVYTNTTNNSSPEKEIFTKSLYFLSSKMSSPSSSSSSSPDNLERAQEENIQDLFQLTVCIASFFLALSFGVSLRNAPIVLLPFLSIAIFISTRMLRYFATFLISFCVCLLLLALHRFKMLPIQILEPENNGDGGGISMFQVALIIILSIFILGTCIGFLYRAKGGLGSRFINSNTTNTTTNNNSNTSNGSITVDVVGVLFFLYSLILTFLEVIFSSSSLSTTITTTTDLIVHYSSSSSSLNQNIIPQYPYNLSIITSLLTLLIATHLLRQEAIHIKSALMIVCSVMTKFLIITSNSYTPSSSSSSSSSISQHVTEILTVLGSLFLLFLPFVTNHSNLDNYSSTQQQQQWQHKVIKKIESKIRLHTLIFFPIASYFLSHYYFIISLEDDTPALNMFAMYWMAWGLYSISLIVYLLPQNSGSEGIKQAAVVSLLLGIVTALFCSRSSSGYDDEYYQYYSSIIQHDEKNSSRQSATTSSGKWGLVVAITSWLFALSGPLRSLALKTSVRRSSSSSQSKNNRTTVGGKSSAIGTFNLSNGGFQDDLLLVQLFLFALFFGSGLAWFIVMEMFENEGIRVIGEGEEKDIFNKTVTMISCIITAFLGTFTTTLAVYLELHQLEDSLLSLVKYLLILPTLFSLLLAYLDWNSDGLYYNNTMKRGGSLTTYMVICAIVSFSVGVGLRTRAISHRNYMTRGVANLGLLISWFISMILSLQSFGLSLLYSPTSSYENSAGVLNIPILIIVAVSSILTLLENESTSLSPRRVRFGSPIGIRFHFESSEYFPKTMMLCGIVSVLLSSSIYILFLRGCRLDGNYDDNDWSSQLVEHLDLFKKNQYYVEESSANMMKLDENNNNQDVQTTVDSMVHTKILHSRSMKIFAKLSGSGFCTSKSSYGPFLHLLGLIFVLPGIISVLRYFLLLKGRSFLKTVAIVPFSLYPLLVCSGIHALRVLSLINFVGLVLQTISMRNRSWKGKMHI